MCDKEDVCRMNHFRLQDFACKCCGANAISIMFVKKLDDARELAGIPFAINSGWRCKAWNKHEKGRPTSSHLIGLAADIRCLSDSDRYIMEEALRTVGLTRFGMGKNFLHVDDDQDKPQKRIWVY